MSGESAPFGLFIEREQLEPETNGKRMNRWRDAGLLLVGHGSSWLPTARQTTDRLAGAIRRRKLFGEVVSCFWKADPVLSLDLVRSGTVYVVPNFAGAGMLTRQSIPDKLGISGTWNHIGGRSVIYADPIGCHPRLAELLGLRAADLCRQNHMAPSDTGLLIVGHGSRRCGGDRDVPETVAASLRSVGEFAQVATAYLEQSPFVGDWPRLIDTEKVVVAPWLLSRGKHVIVDLMAHFDASVNCRHPTIVRGRTVWLLADIAHEEELVEVVLDLVRRAEAVPTGCLYSPQDR